MRLPKLADDSIDVELVKKLVDEFLAAGFTYFDTAWAYSGSEVAIRQALVERYPREKFQLATKLAAWRATTQDEALKQFDESLERTGAKFFDFYLLHNMGDYRTKYFDDFKVWDFVAEKKSAGLIKNLGFSFHATPEELEKILTAHSEVDFVQLQINWADWDAPAIQSRACYEVAQRHGKKVVVMEPVKGGMLAAPPAQIEKILRDAEPESSPASWDRDMSFGKLRQSDVQHAVDNPSEINDPAVLAIRLDCQCRKDLLDLAGLAHLRRGLTAIYGNDIHRRPFHSVKRFLVHPLWRNRSVDRFPTESSMTPIGKVAVTAPGSFP